MYASSFFKWILMKQKFQSTIKWGYSAFPEVSWRKICTNIYVQSTYNNLKEMLDLSTENSALNEDSTR